VTPRKARNVTNVRHKQSLLLSLVLVLHRLIMKHK